MNEISPNLSLPYIMPSQAQKHVTHNEAIRALDALVQIAVLARNVAMPPPSPAEGDRYLVPSGAVEPWADHVGFLAAWQDGAWAFYAPQSGWTAWVQNEAVLLVHHNGGWAEVGQNAGGGGESGGSGAITGAVVQALAATGLTHRLDTTAVATTGGYDWRSYYQAASWSNGPSNEPTYIDDVFASGINMAGVALKADPNRQYAAWHMESKFYSNANQLKPWTENFLEVIDTTGAKRRPIGWVGAHDGSFGNVSLAQTVLYLQGNNHQPKIDYNFETNAVLVYDGISTTYLQNDVPPHRQRNAAADSTIALPYVDDGDLLVMSRALSTPRAPGSRNASGPKATARGMNTDAFVAEAPGGLASTFALACGVTQGASAAIAVTADGTTTVTTAGTNAVPEAAIGRGITGTNVPANTRVTDVLSDTSFKTNNALPASVTSITLAARTRRTTEWSVDTAGVVTYDYSARLAFRDKSASNAIIFHLFDGNVGIGSGAAYPTGAKLVVDGPVRLKSYTVATLPAPNTAGAGAIVYVSDASGAPTLACSDGAAWRVAAPLGAVVA
ncbi:DUF2793 domain-containing protein [Tianweitania sediminis]|uniref:DUF2793 domain-containing protein n=1 Tax=Tianweitania sediminis TaxID=1502156 RepID=A0A8J7QXH0_9HYPH|nr:DUF2793 domain-containing protein [Tianweitania sediminis]MBP0438578.1 DUF2793 domain-containing protein [Tianweitania sediminis]